MSNYFHSFILHLFILSFNLNLASNEGLLSRRRKTFDSNDQKRVAIQRFSLKQRLVISLIFKGSVLVNVDLVIVYEKGIVLWNV